MTDQTRLDPQELVPGRPFTDPGLIRLDLAALDHMRAALCALLADPAPAPDMQEYLRLGERTGRGHDVTIARRAALLAGGALAVVGFFGHRRRDIDLSPLLEADAALTLEFTRHTGVLSYSRLELEDGNWGNMVLLADEAAGHLWLGSERHAYAVRQLAPRFYHTVRLHNATLPAGVFGSAPIHLVRTRYYDYQAPLPWIAIRDA
jgi:hypothetical protein